MTSRTDALCARTALLGWCAVVVLGFNAAFASPQLFGENIKFHYYDRDGAVFEQLTIHQSQNYRPSDLRAFYCPPTDKFAIIVHGWKESCTAEWVTELVQNLNVYRGGCVMCMDYSYYTQASYFRLVKQFREIGQVLTVKLYELEASGHRLSAGYMFGFSFGAQLVTESGRQLGGQLRQIDVCDLAGPGFDSRPSLPHRLAAKNVQCIHTSADKGTRFSTCHQDWLLGNCGRTQVAAGPYPKGSHGLCPYFYNSAFTHRFAAVNRTQECRSQLAADYWPTNFQMGYTEKRRRTVFGELFALTSAQYPYNVETYDTDKGESEADRDGLEDENHIGNATAMRL